MFRAVQSFYVDGRACARVGNNVSEWFPVNVREVNAMVLGERLELLGVNCGRFGISQLLFTDDKALVADSEDKLCKLVSEFGRVYERRNLRVNVRKSKVMRCSRCGNVGRMHVILYGGPLKEGDCFKVPGRKWQLMEDVKRMWYSEWMRGIERGER